MPAYFDARRQSVKFVIGFALLITAGCEPAGPKDYPVSGTVTWNGQPLPEGDVLFTAAQGIETPDPGKVVDGKFTFRAKEGQKKVEIRATREEGAPDSVMGAPMRRQYLPARYNDATTLTAEVTPAGPNEFRFELMDKK